MPPMQSIAATSGQFDRWNKGGDAVTTIQIVNTILILLLPVLIALCYVFAQFQIQRMPTHQRAALEQFARQAVRYVERVHVDSPDKRALAMAYTSDFFRLLGLPVPPSDLLEVAIGAAMYEIQGHG
jgi:hypothetical protein